MIAALAVRYEIACRAILLILAVSVGMVAYTIRGFVIGGVFPSIAAAFPTYRAWLIDPDKSWSAVRGFRTFGRAWREEFPRANLPGAALTGVWIVLWIDHRILQQVEIDTVGLVASGVLLVVIALTGVFSIVFWAVRANFAESTRWAVRASVGVVLARPLCTIMLLGLQLIYLWLALSYPAAVIALGPGAPLFAVCLIVFAFARLPGASARHSPTTPESVETKGPHA
jgi:uncharacterized membrane protein YesL